MVALFGRNRCKMMAGAVVLAALVMPLGSVRADVVVSPNTLETVEGNSDNAFPFNIGGPSQRYQQVYASADFDALEQLITAISFRPDLSFGDPFASTLPDIQINLAYTNAAPDALSSTFADNISANDTIVFARGPLTLSSSDTPSDPLNPNSPRNFDITIPFTTSFIYDPSQGNLLLDVRNFGGGSTTQFDADNASGDSISRATNFGSGDVNSTMAANHDSLGLVTQFTTSAVAPEPAPVPEPGTMALMGVGLASLAAARRRRKSA